MLCGSGGERGAAAEGIEDENRQLKRPVAELNPHGEALKAVIRQNSWSLLSLGGIPAERVHGLLAVGSRSVQLSVMSRDSDRNAFLREDLVQLAQQKPRYGSPPRIGNVNL